MSPRDVPAEHGRAGAVQYHDAVGALADRGRFGVRLGLARTRALLHAFGDPQLELRGALVGGTNGKGSVLALASSAMRAAGIRTGTTPKPHLVSYRERLEIDGRPIDPVTFARLVREVLAAADGVAKRHGPPTEFELLTAMLFRWFAEERVEAVLVEVGLGGRLDATHAWDGGVAAITNVALDHMAWLGDTIPEIAREKAAIIERGDLAVTGATGEALSVIRRRARRVGAPLDEVSAPTLLGWDRDGIEVDLRSLGPTRISLRGRHQAENAAVADALLDGLAGAGIATVDAASRRRGYATARWPGRLEILEVDGREVVLDGAHNPAGAAALATALDDLRPHLAGGGEPEPARPPLTFVHASMADKDVDGIIRALDGATALRGTRIVATQMPGDRALDAAELGRRWRAVRPDATIMVVADVAAALARALADAAGPVVVAGSLYLVGEARRRWLDDPLLRDPEVPGA
ncbi:MAG TPA: bifunctional folylpolyglutamate synthase/dihydrofolate synthase [Candidatus Limnocylindria bacterium]|nr:bifunctional folylpolyglutamate synthase/dihydrofolate synthase [Candidatus Limnocylindria bacterium]